MSGKSSVNVALKVVLSIVLFLVGGGVADALLGVLSSRIYGSLSLATVLQVSMITPVWVPSPVPWRFVAALAALAAGIGTWMLSGFSYSSDIDMQSAIVGFISAGAAVVSLGVSLWLLRVGRSRSAAGSQHGTA